MGDLNGDGLPDILWGDTSTTPARLHILLARKAGGYASATDLVLTPSSGIGCRLFDANGEGKLDLICPQSSAFQASLLLFLGNGDGSFAAPATTQLPTSNGNYFCPVIVPPADLNGDGILDLAVIDTLNYKTYILLGDGHDNFKSASSINSNAEFVTSDINGDSKPELRAREAALCCLAHVRRWDRPGRPLGRMEGAELRWEWLQSFAIVTTGADEIMAPDPQPDAGDFPPRGFGGVSEPRR